MDLIRAQRVLRGMQQTSKQHHFQGVEGAAETYLMLEFYLVFGTDAQVVEVATELEKQVPELLPS